MAFTKVKLNYVASVAPLVVEENIPVSSKTISDFYYYIAKKCEQNDSSINKGYHLIEEEIILYSSDNNISCNNSKVRKRLP